MTAQRAFPEEILARLLGPEGPCARFAVQAEERQVEVEALMELLERNAVSTPETHAVARAVACGCMGEQHLWKDLGFPGRPTVRQLFEAYFPVLAEMNDRDMRWKRFLYKCLCRWDGFGSCPSPSCSECDDYPICFAPENE
jgi:nitrogen fixation protein NifQ